MIKPLSNQKTYDLFYTEDPAVIPLPEVATEEQITERNRRLEVALETGRWDDVTIPGETLTRFRMRQLRAEEYGEIATMIARRESRFEVYALAFRLALQDAVPLPEGAKVEFIARADGSPIATTAFLDKAGINPKIGADIIIELGRMVVERAEPPSGKS